MRRLGPERKSLGLKLTISPRLNQAARDEEEGEPATAKAEDWLLGTFLDRGF